MICLAIGAALAVLVCAFWEEINAFPGWLKRVWLAKLEHGLEEMGGQVARRKLAFGLGLASLAAGLAGAWALGSAWGLAAGAVLGAGLPWAWARGLEAARRKAFAAQLVDTLEMVTGALRAGQSLQQALANAARESSQPSAALWGEVAGAVRMGADMEAALDRLGARFAGTPLQNDLNLLATAVAVNRSTGGNLAELFQRQADTLRERARLRAQVSALTAQGRLSGWVIGLLPLLLMAAIQMLDPELIRPLFTTPIGWGLLGAGLVMELMGAFMIARIVDIEL